MPPGRCRFEGYSGPLTDCSLDEAIVVDLYEVTRADWLHYRPDAAADGLEWRTAPAQQREATLAWPAFLSRREAEALARDRGMRLLTAREWLHVAVGRRPLPYPWGRLAQRSSANTFELGLGRPAAVGTFESGKSEPFGCYDLAGNVWEWVSDWVPGYDTWVPDYVAATWLDPRLGPLAAVDTDVVGCAMGGGFLDRGRETFGVRREGDVLVFHAVTLDPDHRAPDVGARMGADAAVYLWSKAPAWGSGDAARARVRAVGRRWAEAVGPGPVARLLEELLARPGPPEALAWLLEGAREET